MDFRATKTPLEREDEETERLVRPAPKLKPPRHDKRRERMEPEEDPDLKREAAIAKVIAAARERIPARNRETGDIVQISPNTLKEKPGLYEPVDEAEEKEPTKAPESEATPEKEKPESPEEQSAKQFYQKAGDALRELASQDKALKSKLKSYTIPGQFMHGMVKENPDFPAAKMLPGVQLPKGIRTIADVQRALATKPSKQKPLKNKKQPVEEPQEEAPAPPKPEKPQEQDPEAPPAEEAKPEAPVEQAPAAPVEQPGEPPVETKKTKKKAPAEPEKPLSDAEDLEAYKQERERSALDQKSGDELRALANENKALAEKLKDFLKKDGVLAGLLKKSPDRPVGGLFPELTDPEGKDPKKKGLPEGIKTVADLHRALMTKPGKPKKPEPVPQTALEKAGIPAPQRRETSKQERQEAMVTLSNSFPPQVAARLIEANLHPDDVRSLIRNYNAAKVTADVSNVGKFVDKVSAVYETDPSKVGPPKEWKGVEFDKLSPEEQGEAARQHVMKTVALSLAASDVLTKKLSNKGGISGRARVPEPVARMLANTMLKKTTPELSNKLADEVFTSTVKDGNPLKFSDGVVKKLLVQVGSNPAAQKMARAYFQATDYQRAKDKFLGSGALSEWDSPGGIVKALKGASQFFRGRNAVYGDDFTTHPAMNLFRTRVMGRLKTLSPARHQSVQKELAAVDHAEYQDLNKQWSSKFKAWKQKRDSYRKALAAYHENPQGKKPPKFLEPKPVKPQKPLSTVNPQEGESMWGEVLNPKPTPKLKKPKKPGKKALPPEGKKPEPTEGQVKTANFTYPTGTVMGSPNKTSVYHGVDPYAYGPGAYSGWLQPHQRDLGEADFGTLLAAAKNWLESPLLTAAVDGMIPDSRLRAALDLAIYEGPYNRAINPNDYNRLLVQLGGSGKAVTATSSCNSASTGGDPMKVSQKIRKYAARVADHNSKLAYEMLDFADRIAEQEQPEEQKPEPEEKKEASVDKYAAIRSAIIQHAHSLEPAKRAALLPILQTLKDLG